MGADTGNRNALIKRGSDVQLWMNNITGLDSDLYGNDRRHVRVNRSTTSAGTGFDLSRDASAGSRPTQTRVSKPSTASLPSLNTRWVTSKLERRNSLMVVCATTSSPYLAGARNCARASTTGKPAKS